MKPESTQPEQPIDYNQPIAYDSQGRPLYAHPPQQPQAQPPIVEPQQPAQVVHMSRAIDPAEPELTEKSKQRHDESLKKYPFLNLSRGEYVINMVQRHPIGLLIPVLLTTFLIIITVVGLVAYPAFAASSGLPPVDQLALPALMLIILYILGGYIVIWVYLQNKFFLTNESVIQEIQTSLFSKHEQTVSLGSIEDASFRQTGIIQTLLNYGSIRLSTEGEETTYRFQFVSNPKHQIAVLNNAVESFKNGRPVTGE